jgi:S-adenosylmethionine hydrolase
MTYRSKGKMSSTAPVISVTTDFGTRDGFVGTLKGVIWRICPTVKIADISQDIPPQDVLTGAITLWRAYPFFPLGTIHLAVVDPGVGTSRRPIAIQCCGHTFVGPDNGLFTPIFEDAEKKNSELKIVHTTDKNYHLKEISQTFHGRDIFAPIAAHLANGTPLDALGPLIDNPIRISLPKPKKSINGWQAHVTVVDVFGNCTTDLPATYIADKQNVIFQIGGNEVMGLVTSYGQKQPGDLIALVDSENYIEIAVVNGSAARKLGARIGDIVEVLIK